jgi:hypothetical protein
MKEVISMKIFICSKEWLDDYMGVNLKFTRSIRYSSDCEFYYLEAVSKKLPASMIDLRKKEMIESKKWLKEYQDTVIKMKKMNIVHRLLYKRGK